MEKNLVSVGIVTLLLLSISFVQIIQARNLEPLSSKIVNENSISSPLISSTDKIISINIDPSRIRNVRGDRIITLLNLAKTYTTDPKIAESIQSIILKVQNNFGPCDILEDWMYVFSGLILLAGDILDHIGHTYGIENIINAIIAFLQGDLPLWILILYIGWTDAVWFSFSALVVLYILYLILCGIPDWWRSTSTMNIVLSPSTGSLMILIPNHTSYTFATMN